MCFQVNQFDSHPEILADGETPVLQFFELDKSMWAYLGIELVFVFVLFTLAWAGLSFKQHSSR